MSRELDVNVARALGLDPFWDGIDGWRYKVSPVPSDPRHDYLENVAAYSTDIGTAWLLIGHLRRQGWVMTLSVNHYTSEPWDCRFFLESERQAVVTKDRRVIAHGKTAEQAICLAFLEAMR